MDINALSLPNHKATTCKEPGILFPRLIINANNYIISSYGGIERLSAVGILSIKGNRVDFERNQRSFNTTIKLLNNSLLSGSTSPHYFLASSNGGSPVIVVAESIDTDDTQFETKYQHYLLSFIADNCICVDTSSFSTLFSLTRTESRVLKLVCAGHTLIDTADTLHCKVGSIRFHIKNIYQKTGVKKQAELVSLVFKLMLILDHSSTN